jgi:phage terminase large subunit
MKPAVARSAGSLGAQHRPYQPFGAARDLFYAKDGEVLLSGPAGTGKSRGCLEKLHLCAEKYAGMRGLIVRKTRESLSESGLVTFETKVVPENHPILLGPNRQNRHAYRYPNGSEIIVAGFRQHSLDASQKVMSTDYDMAFVQEAIELTDDEWEKLTTRLRNGVMPYQQLMADTNPGPPKHWLKLRCDAGKARLLESRHEDNPVLWSAAARAWTEQGVNYIAKLDALTGPRKQRLRYGRWVQSEGVVYEAWDVARHIVDEVELQRGKQFVAGVDWGYTRPGAIEVGMVDGDGRLTIVAEVYHTHRTQDWWIDQAKALRERYRITAFACDPSEPEYITQWKRAGLPAREALNDVRPGITAVEERLKLAGDGRPRLTYLRTARVVTDPDLVEAKLPLGLVDEMDSYCWDDKAKKEQPVKEHDHACDALRYLVAFLDLQPKRRLNIWV